MFNKKQPQGHTPAEEDVRTDLSKKLSALVLKNLPAHIDTDIAAALVLINYSGQDLRQKAVNILQPIYNGVDRYNHYCICQKQYCNPYEFINRFENFSEPIQIQILIKCAIYMLAQPLPQGWINSEKLIDLIINKSCTTQEMIIEKIKSEPRATMGGGDILGH